MRAKLHRLRGCFVGITTFSGRSGSGKICRVTSTHVFLLVFVRLSVFRIVSVRISNIRSIHKFPSCPLR
ncbi:MAG TPA: hypothetical protein VJ824_00685 [Bacillota bacterium]|nr:hypothetical protein [Bacillota bacterium]